MHDLRRIKTLLQIPMQDLSLEQRTAYFDPIKKSKRIFEVVASQIEKSIIKGIWKPGDRLPAEGELSEQFGVSRHTIREALRTLELSSYLTVKTGSGGGTPSSGIPSPHRSANFTTKPFRWTRSRSMSLFPLVSSSRRPSSAK